jgi:hypothetical protein
MAIPFLHNIDLSDNQALHMRLHTGSQSPFGGSNDYQVGAGQIWFDSQAKYIKIHDGSQFVKAPREITITTGSGQNEASTTLGSFQNLKLIESTNITFTVSTDDAAATRTLTISSQDTTYGLDVPTAGLTAPAPASNQPGEANITLTDSNDTTTSVLIKGTNKEVDVTGDAANDTIQIGLPDNVTITGDLTINGGELFYHANHTIKSTDPANTAAGKTLTLSGGDVIAGGTVNLTGGDITIQGGAGKGTGDGGDILFKIAKASVSSGSTVNALSTALTISGNDGDATFANSVIITGDLTVNGDTTSVNVETMTVQDPVIELGGLENGGALTSNDSKDKGISFNWFQDGSPGAAKLGFFGYDEDTGYFTFIPDATNTSEVFSGTQGVAELGGVRVPDSGLVLQNVAVDSTATELNKLDSDEAPLAANVFTDSLQDSDAIIIGDSSDSNTTKKVLLSKVAEYVDQSERKSIKISGGNNVSTFHVEHGFGTHLVSVQLLDYGDNGTGATYDQVYADVTVGTVPSSGGTSTDANDYVNVTFATAPSASQDYIALVSKFPNLP